MQINLISPPWPEPEGVWAQVPLLYPGGVERRCRLAFHPSMGVRVPSLLLALTVPGTQVLSPLASALNLYNNLGAGTISLLYTRSLWGRNIGVQFLHFFLTNHQQPNRVLLGDPLRKGAPALSWLHKPQRLLGEYSTVPLLFDPDLSPVWLVQH